VVPETVEKGRSPWYQKGLEGRGSVVPETLGGGVFEAPESENH
jgi:hypothetical protein